MEQRQNSTFDLEAYYNYSLEVISNIDKNLIETIASSLFELRKSSGKLVILGFGGSAANASHLVNDFRKLCKINAFSPTDNVSEFSARVNDDDNKFLFNDWLETLNFSKHDKLLLLSVGGGSRTPSVSESLIEAAIYAKQLNSEIFAFLGRDGGEIAKIADVSIVFSLPENASQYQTPISESLQLLVGHSVVFHPKLKVANSKW